MYKRLKSIFFWTKIKEEDNYNFYYNRITGKMKMRRKGFYIKAISEGFSFSWRL